MCTSTYLYPKSIGLLLLLLLPCLFSCESLPPPFHKFLIKLSSFVCIGAYALARIPLRLIQYAKTHFILMKICLSCAFHCVQTFHETCEESICTILWTSLHCHVITTDLTFTSLHCHVSTTDLTFTVLHCHVTTTDLTFTSLYCHVTTTDLTFTSLHCHVTTTDLTFTSLHCHVTTTDLTFTSLHCHVTTTDLTFTVLHCLVTTNHLTLKSVSGWTVSMTFLYLNLYVLLLNTSHSIWRCFGVWWLFWGCCFFFGGGLFVVVVCLLLFFLGGYIGFNMSDNLDAIFSTA